MCKLLLMAVLLSSSIASAQLLSGYPTRPFNISLASVGTGQTSGITLTNPTLATSGAQKYSPMLTLKGNGWKTNATAASQSVSFSWQTRPVQGAAAPTGDLVFWRSIAGGAQTEMGALRTSGLNGASGFRLVTAGNRGLEFSNDSNELDVVFGASVYMYFTTGVFSGYTDNTVALGGTSRLFSTTYAYAYVGGEQTEPSSATPSFDCTTGGEAVYFVLTANVTSWTMANGGKAQVCTIYFVQDGTGNRTLAGTPANVTFAGSALTLSTAASKVDALTFRWDNTNTKWREIGRALNQ